MGVLLRLFRCGLVVKSKFLFAVLAIELADEHMLSVVEHDEVELFEFERCKPESDPVVTGVKYCRPFPALARVLLVLLLADKVRGKLGPYGCSKSTGVGSR